MRNRLFIASGCILLFTTTACSDSDATVTTPPALGAIDVVEGVAADSELTLLTTTGVNTIGVTLPGQVWADAADELCAGDILLTNAATDFIAANGLSNPSSEVIGALRTAAGIRCPGQQLN